ncbi:MAG: ABC transporter permease subunit [Bacillota bacterium]
MSSWPRSERKAVAGRLQTAITVGAVLLALHVASRYTPEFILPPLLRIAAALGEVLVREWPHILATLGRLGQGMLAAFVVGSSLGILMGALRGVAAYARPLLYILMAVPALSWILFAVLWFPTPQWRVFFVITVVSLPFYALNIYEGIRALPAELAEAVQVFRPSHWQMLRILVIPHVVPYVMMTTRSVVGYAIRMTTFAELIGSAVGIGARLNNAQAMFRIDAVFAWTFVLVGLNFALQGLLDAADRRLLRWRPEGVIR